MGFTIENMEASQAETDTQTQTQTQTQTETPSESQEVWATAGTTLPVIWGRLYAAELPPQRNLGVPPGFRGVPLHSLPAYLDLTIPEFNVGRAITCNLHLKKGLVRADTLSNVSKVHFRLTRDMSKPLCPVILHDLSYNGTFVNGHKVGKGNIRILDTYDKIALVQSTSNMFVFMDLLKNEQDKVPEYISKKYYISRQLGQGACGIVKLVYNRITCEKFAMKEIAKKRLGTSNTVANNSEKIMNEYKILKALKHPFIISTEEVYDTPEAVFIILELMEGGELFDHITEHGRLSEQTSKIIFRQMILAVKYLHNQGITHRDLKPENILLKKSENGLLVKISDFGLSKFVSGETFLKTMCGTPNYVAPEVFLADGRREYSSQVDVWSIGVILFICLSGYTPFSRDYDGMSLMEQIIKGKIRYSRSHWEGISNEAKNIVRRMLTVDPEKRINVNQILLHPWMQDEAVKKIVDNLMEASQESLNAKSAPRLTVIPPMKRNLSEINKENDPPAKRMRLETEQSDNSDSTWVNSSSEELEEVLAS